MGRKAKTKKELEEIIKNNFNNVELISEYKNSKEDVFFKCKDCGHIWKQRFFNLSGCPNCKIDKRYETLSHDDYLYKLKERGILRVIPIEKYISAQTKIKHKCMICNYEWSIKPNNVLSGYGCPFCAGQAVVKGKNDLNTTDPNIAILLLSKEDGFKYSRMSGKKLDWICPQCNNIIKQKMISNVVQQGLSCPRCSDGNSIPNKLITNILDSINISFETEKSFAWSKNRRYDVYIPSINCIIEMHGKQHFDIGFEYCGGRTLFEEKNNDLLKHRLAHDNGITNYITINCESSNLEWIKNSIMNSSLPTLIDINYIDWNKCYEASLHSNIIIASKLWNEGCSVSEIMQKLHISNVTACEYLNKANNINLCTYLGFNERLKKVICLNTNEIFDSIKEAKHKYNAFHIGDCCRGLRKYAGTHAITGEKLVWQYYDEYIKEKADCNKTQSA